MAQIKGISVGELLHAFIECEFNYYQAAKRLGCDKQNVKRRIERLEAKGKWHRADPYNFANIEEKLLTHEKLRDCLELHMQADEIAAEYNLSIPSVKARIQRLKQSGYDPDNDRYHKNPQEQAVKGYSTLVRVKDKSDESAGTVLEWVKTDVDRKKWLEIAEQAAKDFYEDLPAIDISPAPTNYDTDIIPWFQIGDGHCGMIAYSNEVGESFDLKIFERDLCKAMATLIDRAPDCERCVIHDLGDMTHYETFDAVTLASGHALDFDTRYPKMIRVYIRTMRFIIERALSKFKFVDVIINQGNHSRSNDIWMRELLEVAYGHTGRVNCLNNESVFIPYRMGNTFVMCHHSDKCKPNKLAHVMATDFAHDWGESTYRYIDIGHIHHSMVSKEHPGVKIESWNQLATSDKYAHDGGWRSRSCLTVVYRSKTYGEKGRETITLEEVRDLLDGAVGGTNVGKRRKVYTV